MIFESDIEIAFCDACKAQGWMPVKLVDLGARGWPDRTVFKPGGKTFFAELKRGKRGVLSFHQRERIAQLRDSGFCVYLITNDNEIENCVTEECKNETT